MAKASLDKATDLFENDKFAEAKAAAQEGLSQEPDAPTARQLKLLVRKCATHLEDTATVTGTSTAAAPACEAEPPAPAAPTPTVTPKPQTSCRHEWFQTPTSVTFTFYVKNRKEDQVTVNTTKRSLEVSIKLDNDKEFQLTHAPLFAEIDPTKTEVHVKQPKIEVVVQKAMPNIHWSAAELVGEAAAEIAMSAAPPPSALPKTQQHLSYPNSRGRDWSTFKTEEELDEKAKEGTLSGDEGLNKMFQQVYQNASEETRRAMIKSYTESNGTVLSTNWEDVGKREVKGEAPRGMVMQKYEQ